MAFLTWLFDTQSKCCKFSQHAMDHIKVTVDLWRHMAKDIWNVLCKSKRHQTGLTLLMKSSQLTDWGTYTDISGFGFDHHHIVFQLYGALLLPIIIYVWVEARSGPQNVQRKQTRVPANRLAGSGRKLLVNGGRYCDKGVISTRVTVWMCTGLACDR